MAWHMHPSCHMGQGFGKQLRDGDEGCSRETDAYRCAVILHAAMNVGLMLHGAVDGDGFLNERVVVCNLQALECLVVELALVALGVPMRAAKAVATAALEARQAQLLPAGRNVAPAQHTAARSIVRNHLMKSTHGCPASC
eukprot:361329-Chlamydomonas_euryale.AAC.5